MVEMLYYKVNGISFNNRVPNGTELKLRNDVKYNINYFGEEKRCLGRLDFRVTDENMQPFEIRVEMEALFRYQEGDDQADIHVNTFDQIFPFLRQIIHTTTAVSGMPGLMIPMLHLDKNNVQVSPVDDAEGPLN